MGVDRLWLKTIISILFFSTSVLASPVSFDKCRFLLGPGNSSENVKKTEPTIGHDEIAARDAILAILERTPETSGQFKDSRPALLLGTSNSELIQFESVQKIYIDILNDRIPLSSSVELKNTALRVVGDHSELVVFSKHLRSRFDFTVRENWFTPEALIYLKSHLHELRDPVVFKVFYTIISASFKHHPTRYSEKVAGDIIQVFAQAVDINIVGEFLFDHAQAYVTSVVLPHQRRLGNLALAALKGYIPQNKDIRLFVERVATSPYAPASSQYIAKKILTKLN